MIVQCSPGLINVTPLCGRTHCYPKPGQQRLLPSEPCHDLHGGPNEVRHSVRDHPRLRKISAFTAATFAKSTRPQCAREILETPRLPVSDEERLPSYRCVLGMCRVETVCGKEVSPCSVGDERHTAQYVVLTDEHHAAIFDSDSDSKARHRREPRVAYTYSELTRSVTLRAVLGCLINCTPFTQYHGGYASTPSVQGALNKRPELSKLDPIANPSDPKSFRDFDLFTMQRSRSDLVALLLWKQKEREKYDHLSLDVGVSLRVEVDGFLRRETPLWRCPFPPAVLPQETLEVVSRNPRPRLADVDTLLVRGKEGSGLKFVIEEKVRCLPDTFSQVFFGRLSTADGSRSSPVCLKLFLESAFPVNNVLKDHDNPFYDDGPSLRLGALNFAVDMMKREESAYSRLQHLEGTLLPQCYGFHIFTLPDGSTAYGMLTEILPGPMVAERDLSVLDHARQSQFVTRIRHALRALLYAGVEHSDLHLNQILLPSLALHPEMSEDESDIVILDFSFSRQRLGDEGYRHGVAPKLPGNCYAILGGKLIDAGIEFPDGDHEGWFPLDDEEI